MVWIASIALLVAVTALVLAGAVARSAARSVPQALSAGFADLGNRMLACESIVEGQRSQLLAARQEIDGVLESVEDTLERVERKRRSAAASASRANPAEQEPLDPRAALAAQVRAAGFEVM